MTPPKNGEAGGEPMAFESFEPFPGVFHIRDRLGVCMTLLSGETGALLIDTGYGTENVRACAESLTDRPLTVLLTHGHHDHALGSRWFSKVWVLEDDLAVYDIYTNAFWRRHVIEDSAGKGVAVDAESMLAARMPPAMVLTEEAVDLGGLTARVVPCPGHTPGSAVVYVPERKLLISGDDWNPSAWLFFREALSVQDYRRNMRRVLDLPFEHVLCPHQFRLFDRQMIDAFVEGLTDETLDAAREVTVGNYRDVRTAAALLPMEQVLVFDKDKYEACKGKGTEDD